MVVVAVVVWVVVGVVVVSDPDTGAVLVLPIKKMHIKDLLLGTNQLV